MSEKDKKESGEVSRRQFLTGAGLIVGGAAIGAGIAYPLASDGDGGTITETVTVKTYVAPDGTTFDTLAALAAYMEGLPDGGIAGITGAVNLTVNGVAHELIVEPNWTLAQVLREQLGLTGTKLACRTGSCGACTVLQEGKPILSCLALAIECEGKKILTIESLATGEELHPIQDAFIEHMGFQCGFCTPAMILSTKALLDTNLNPTREEIQEALSGNLCRCGGYTQIFDSVLAAADNMRGGA